MSRRIILHVSEVNIATTSGMGRVEYFWKKAFENAGFEFVHIGPTEVGKLSHKMLFGIKAYLCFKRMQISPEFFIVHEAVSGFFVKKDIPCFVESHGVERKNWEKILNGLIPLQAGSQLSLKTRIWFPLWRLSTCDRGLKYADKLLLINSDDVDYVKRKYKRLPDDILMFRNGVFPVKSSEKNTVINTFTILFNASWIKRKGTDVLIKAARIVYDAGLTVNYILAGTGKNEQTVLNDWPDQLKPHVKVITHFDQGTELSLIKSSSIFVLPSYSEGQPLSLLQAMAAGKCCLTTDCCGQKDIIKNGVTGLLFEPGNFKQLANLITKCHKNAVIVRQIGLNAKKDMENYDWKKVANDVVKFITKTEITKKYS